MSELRLIRHGQATPFEADTDLLSRLCETQARAVGAAFQAEGWVPTHVLHGPLVRQRRSAELAARQASGWPAAVEDARLAEFDGDGLMGTLADSARSQSRSIGEVESAVQALDSATQQNAALVEQTTSAATSLADSAHQLSQEVSFFKLA